ncbi:hypothetical protein SOM46_09300 [Pseudomonas fluorescens]|uniref:hypothetical protein n=1 Tax=Pseudomonas fluorescens TaxID=294 RepID=UPI001782B95A|nr:hypothetical protein [Pseudomonas fluorescens]MBD8235639.1 hypothetical protein [Pseudomonas fluorescens]MDY0895147.1 hypothetical protein [Pseudomonas fluorescens]
MKYFLFAPTISYWQWLVMSSGLALTAWLGNGWGLIACLCVVIVGAAVEGVVEAVTHD